MKLPRIMTINDISGYGKCALGVAFPIISACGAEVLPLLTAVLSSNMKFKGYILNDLSDTIGPSLEHIKRLGIRTDGIYTGFMPSEKAIDAVLAYIKDLGLDHTGTILADPIMGDDGRLYSHFSPRLCAKIKELCQAADIITPNLTEAHILSGLPYSAETSLKYVKALALGLLDPVKAVVITGVIRKNRLYNCVADESGYRELETELMPYKIGGTGDIFASILIARLLTGHSIDDASYAAQEFISITMRESVKFDDYENRGVCFEPFLKHL